MPALDFSKLDITKEKNVNAGYVPNKQHNLIFNKHHTRDLRTLIKDTPKVDTFLWRYLIKTLQESNPNYKWKPQYQKRGTCVGQGSKLGVDFLMAIQHILNGEKFPGRCSVAGNYAGSRVDIAGQPGRWDGSNGSWVADWLIKYGTLLLKDIGLPEDSLDPDEQLAVKWCASREGVPPEYESKARLRPVKDAPLMSTFEEARAAINNGYPIIICTSYIPTGARDANGFSKLRRQGGHCTLLGGYRSDIEGMLYINSWNGWASGPKYPEDQPEGSVWLTPRDVQTILNARDSYAISHVQGLERQRLKFKLL